MTISLSTCISDQVALETAAIPTDKLPPTESLGILTGAQDLDKLIGGLRPGQLVVIASRPSVGKTTLALNFARSTAIDNRVPTVFYSVGLARDDITCRVLSAQSRVWLRKIAHLENDDHELARLVQTEALIEESPLFIVGDRQLSLTELELHIRDVVNTTGVKLVVIDSLFQWIAQESPEPPKQATTKLFLSLKALAVSLRVAIVITAPLKRRVDKHSAINPDYTPILADLRGSPIIEEVADVVILVNRFDLQEPEHPRAGEIDLIVAKNRNGPTGTVAAAFNEHICAIQEMGGNVNSEKFPLPTPAEELCWRLEYARDILSRAHDWEDHPGVDRYCEFAACKAFREINSIPEKTIDEQS